MVNVDKQRGRRIKPRATVLIAVAASILAVRYLARPLSNLILADECMHSNPEVIEFIVFLGADPNTHSEESLTPLMLVSYRGDVASVKRLLSLGADPYLTDRWGRNAFSVAETSEIKDALKAYRRKDKPTLSQP